MWHSTYEGRLRSWHDLRQDIQQCSKPACIERINQWWFSCPWSSYYLHWDDRADWPDPWQLLEDNIFCSLARGLGMLYTITLLERADLQDAELIETEKDNLVVVDSGKYVLNWDCNTVVNINPAITITHRRVQQSSFNHKIL